MRERVCHISTVHTPFDQRIFHRQCWSLNRAGFEVHLLVQHDQADAVVDGVQVHSVGERRAHSLGLRVGTRVRRFVQAARLARRVRARVYHLHDPELILLGLWLKATTNAAVIFDCHENNTAYLQQKSYLNATVRRVLIGLMAAMERAAARNFDAIVTADNGVATLYRQDYGAKRVIVLHNFPRLDLFARPLEEHRQAKYDVVYHGTIPRYHLEIAFDVASRLKARGIAARWLFFGKCPEFKWAEAEAQRRGIADLFDIDPNPIPHEAVADRVRQARIGFIPLPDLPKFQHNIPTKLFEFMLLEMPTVLSDLPPSRPFVGDGQCAVMIRADDIDGYAAAIASLLAGPATAERMGKEARARVVERFSWERESEHLVGLYASLLGRNPHLVRADTAESTARQAVPPSVATRQPAARETVHS